MADGGYLRHVTDSSKFKDASHLYYRFKDDDNDDALLAATNAGNGTGLARLGQQGNHWSFCPHTVHNSYIMDIGLAEEIERCVATGSVEAKKRAFEKLRNRVREEAEEDAPNWTLTQSQQVCDVICEVVRGVVHVFSLSPLSLSLSPSLFGDCSSRLYFRLRLLSCVFVFVLPTNC